MSGNPPVLDELIERLAKLPGLGRKSATRLSLFFLRQPEDEVRELAQALCEVKEKIKFCSLCHNFTDSDPCPRCSDPRRDRGMICVVETPGDLLALEASGLFGGLYHVLGGALAPLSGVGPDDLKIAELLQRVDVSGADEEHPPIREVVLATGSSPEGEATGAYLAQRLKERGVAVTRLARGIPIGVDLEYVDNATIRQSLENRRSY
ncbi:MAG: recombination mediator RecR [Candidatus Adiutrix sp.]|jgi:recombination protein RecR|nr:recombination mediator RecR [Candidatus Adiutrix sp.]